jgi:hypothetical protein
LQYQSRICWFQDAAAAFVFFVLGKVDAGAVRSGIYFLWLRGVTKEKQE